MQRADLLPLLPFRIGRIAVRARFHDVTAGFADAERPHDDRKRQNGGAQADLDHHSACVNLHVRLFAFDRKIRFVLESVAAALVLYLHFVKFHTRFPLAATNYAEKRKNIPQIHFDARKTAPVSAVAAMRFFRIS